ncbi:MAG: prepilin-type N-terminal cleavage/methylation domain-containing protein [Candidatus Sumerlaeia bacterium]
MTRSKYRTPSSKAFSLLEVLIAVTIFAVCTTALYNSFRIATRAFEMGKLSSETMQSLRFSMNAIQRDLMSVYYEPDHYQELLDMKVAILRNQDAITQAIERNEPIRIPGLITQEADRQEAKNYLGLKAKLQFIGKSKNYIEFTRALPDDGTLSNEYLGIERVKYFLKDHNLYRHRARAFRVLKINPNIAQEFVKANEMLEAEKDKARREGQVFIDWQNLMNVGVLPEDFLPPDEIKYFEEVELDPGATELLARNVSKLEFKYGYFRSGGWSEASDWDSNKKKYRTPKFNLPSDDPQFRQKLMAYIKRATDHLPMAVTVTLEIDPKLAEMDEDEKETKKTSKISGHARSMTTTIWVPTSIETFKPSDVGYFEPTPEEEGAI